MLSRSNEMKKCLGFLNGNTHIKSLCQNGISVPRVYKSTFKKICSVNIPPSPHSLKITSFFAFPVVVEISTEG